MTDAERDAERRRRVLDAALEQFGTAGYASVSNEALCRSAGVAGRDLYRQFGGREGVLIELLADLTEGAIAAVAAALPADASPVPDQLRAGVAAYARYLDSDRRRLRVMWAECIGVSPAVDSARRASHDRFAALIRQRATIGGGDGQPPALAAGSSAYADVRVNVIVTAMHVLLEGWFRLATPPPLHVVVDDAVALALAIGTRPPA